MIVPDVADPVTLYPDATMITLRDRWLWTDDLGIMDEVSSATLKDHSNDMFISGGTTIYPRETKEAVALVVPSPDRDIDTTARRDLPVVEAEG